MNARGAIELIVARIALENGLFAVTGPPDNLVPYLFSALVFVAIATTLTTPLLLRLAILPPADREDGDARISAPPPDG